MEYVLEDSGSVVRRGLLHRFTLFPPSKKVEDELYPPEVEVSLYMVIHLPADLFVNVEDIFRLDSEAVNVSLVPSPVIIDQEEPVFISPRPHALLVHIKLRAETSMAFNIVTQLHVRYPLTFAEGTNAGKMLRRMIVPPPDVRGQTSSSNNKTVPILILKQGPPRPLAILVAAERQDNCTLPLTRARSADVRVQ